MDIFTYIKQFWYKLRYIKKLHNADTETIKLEDDK